MKRRIAFALLLAVALSGGGAVAKLQEPFTLALTGDSIIHRMPLEFWRW